MDLKEHLSAVRKVEWTDEVFTAEDLNKKLDELEMPIILKVIDGYYGAQHIETFSSDQILWIYGKFEQKRIIGIDHEGNHISIANDTHIRFEKKDTEDEDVQPQALSDLLEENPFPVNASFYAADFRAQSINGTELTAQSIGNLKLEKEHLMTTFIGVCLQKETIDAEIQNLPMYLNNKFIMATYKDEGSRQKFEELKGSIERMVNNVADFKAYTGSSDIIVYEKADMNNNALTNYNSLRPKKLTVQKVQRRSKRKSSSGDKATKRFSLANMVATVRNMKAERRRTTLSMQNNKMKGDRASAEGEQLIEENFSESLKPVMNPSCDETDLAKDEAMEDEIINEKPKEITKSEVKTVAGEKSNSKSIVAEVNTGTEEKATNDNAIALSIEEPEDAREIGNDKLSEDAKKPQFILNSPSNAPGLLKEMKNVLKEKPTDDKETHFPSTDTANDKENVIVTEKKPNTGGKPVLAKKPKPAERQTDVKQEKVSKEGEKPALQPKPTPQPRNKPPENSSKIEVSVEGNSATEKELLEKNV